MSVNNTIIVNTNVFNQIFSMLPQNPYPLFYTGLYRIFIINNGFLFLVETTR